MTALASAVQQGFASSPYRWKEKRSLMCQTWWHKPTRC